MDVLHAPYPDLDGAVPVALRDLGLPQSVIVAVPYGSGVVRREAAEPLIDVI